MNTIRPVDEYQVSAEDSGLVIAVESGYIVGAAGIFSHLEAKYRELGAHRVLERAQGNALQRYLITASVLQDFMYNGYDDKPQIYYATVLKNNSASIYNLRKCYLKDWALDSIPSELLEMKQKLATKQGRDMNHIAWMKLDWDAIPLLAKNLLKYDAMHQGWVHKNQSRIMFDLPILRDDQRQGLDELSQK